MALEDHGSYVRGTRTEIDAYKSRQADSQAASAAGGAIAFAGIAVVLGVAAVFALGAAATKKEDSASAEQVETWHNMYSQLWGAERADTLLNKARKSMRFLTLEAILAGILFLPMLVLLFPLVGGIIGIPAHIALTNGSLSELWNQFWQMGRHEWFQQFSFLLNPVAYLIITVIIVPASIYGEKKKRNITLLRRYNTLIYQSYPKATCPHCGKQTRILSLGQCRKCFKFIHSLSYEDAKALSEYEMDVDYDVFQTANNEFFSAEVGRTFRYTRISKWVMLVLKLSLPYAAYIGVLYFGSQFLSQIEIGAAIHLLNIGFLLVAFSLPIGVWRILGKIESGIVKRDVRKFIKAVKAELQRHNVPIGNWQ